MLFQDVGLRRNKQQPGVNEDCTWLGQPEKVCLYYDGERRNIREKWGGATEQRAALGIS